jgi:hypothetical protein
MVFKLHDYTAGVKTVIESLCDTARGIASDVQVYNFWSELPDRTTCKWADMGINSFITLSV